MPNGASSIGALSGTLSSAATATGHHVGRLVAASDGETLREECAHGARTVPFAPWTS
jgi:hypothetical protein